MVIADITLEYIWLYLTCLYTGPFLTCFFFFLTIFRMQRDHRKAVYMLGTSYSMSRRYISKIMCWTVWSCKLIYVTKNILSYLTSTYKQDTFLAADKVRFVQYLSSIIFQGCKEVAEQLVETTYKLVETSELEC